MPELPELEVIKDVLQRRLSGRQVVAQWSSARGGPLILRNLLPHPPDELLVGQVLDTVDRRGKYLILRLLPGSVYLIVNPKLTGRLQLCDPDQARDRHTHFSLTLEGPLEDLRYRDSKRMGQIYLTADLSAVPWFQDQGPEPLQLGRAAFRERIRLYRGELKGILTRGHLLAGIGNAYADEILWAARLHPYRKRTELSSAEIDRLYDSIQGTLARSIEIVRKEMGDQIDLKPRDFFAVHLQSDGPCPRCGGSISSITARNRITNFCRTCQPGGLIKGMGARQP